MITVGNKNENRLRPLTTDNLNRISKGNEKYGYAIISVPKQETNRLKQYLCDKGYSYLMVYGGYKESDLEKSFVVFAYDIKSKVKFDFQEFLTDVKELCDAKSVNQNLGLICEPNEKTHCVALKSDVDNRLFTAIKKWNDILLNNKSQKDTVKCYIDTPPQTLASAHSRYAMGDINHIYGE